MAGSAGSKYAIIDDAMPLKKNRAAAEESEKEEDNADRLRDIFSLIRARAIKKQFVPERTHSGE